MSTQANFAATPRASSALVNTANTNTDGTGGGAFPSVFAAGANGSRIDSLQIKGIVANGSTQAADSVRLWIYNGANKFFLREIIVPVGAGNVSATQTNFETVIALGLVLPTGYSLYASTDIGGATASYHLTAFGGDF